jgi:glycogen debranching enzyme
LKKGIASHLTDWGLATEHVDSPLYREDGYWTGPIWAPSTFIAVTGLDRAGFGDLADEVSEKFCRMCGVSGFPENFNAVTGEPLRCPAYTWTSSVFVLLAQRMTREQS